MNINAPGRRFGWAGVFVLAGVTAAGAVNVCDLSATTVCGRFDASLQFNCAKHMQRVVAVCRKAARSERFGSHEDHCRSACRAGKQAFVLDQRLRAYATETVEASTSGNKAWRDDAVAFWRQSGLPQNVCTPDEFEQAGVVCEKYCSTKARRRDLEELQALAAGKRIFYSSNCRSLPVLPVRQRASWPVMTALFWSGSMRLAIRAA